ncbi:MAG: undecaprenyldiphospho-muramoylpentapeptide beta-N-acetylglucosaminyltransferase [Actinobacteria bacterium]|nr:undecaprenyldiphospho-muramoylpentapeptide beta-N-acetylglucosaminyltransferase [Actinomycetota bacterium]
MNIVLAGGGTAGHTSPLIATAQQLTRLAPDSSLLCVGTPRGLETRVIPEAGLELALIPPVPLPRRPTVDLLKVPGRLWGAVRRSGELLRQHRAEVVVGFGGYVSLPVYLAARRARLPIVLHEQNAVPGLANRIAARFAAHVAVSFPDTALPRAEYLGLPVREAIAGLDRAAAAPAARAAYDLPAGLPVLLVSGGSQGARSINTALAGAVDELLAAGVSVLHVLGQANFTDDLVARTHAGTGAAYRPLAYVDRMEQAYAAADLMLGRSGAGTVMETAMVGLPTVFVPLPHGNGEQARNAGFLVEAGAGVLVPDADLSPGLLAATVLGLAHDPDRLAAMSRRCRELVPSGAAEALARIVLGAGKEG